jgi:hypothetical protein
MKREEACLITPSAFAALYPPFAFPTGDRQNFSPGRSPPAPAAVQLSPGAGSHRTQAPWPSVRAMTLYPSRASTNVLSSRPRSGTPGTTEYLANHPSGRRPQ